MLVLMCSECKILLIFISIHRVLNPRGIGGSRKQTANKGVETTSYILRASRRLAVASTWKCHVIWLWLRNDSSESSNSTYSTSIRCLRPPNFQPQLPHHPRSTIYDLRNPTYEHKVCTYDARSFGLSVGLSVLQSYG